MTPTNFPKPMLKRVMLLILFLAIIVFIKGGPPVFTNAPLVTAQWQISSPGTFHLGDVIQATLVITTQPGVSLDWTEVPNVGDVLPLPPKIDNTSYDDYDMPSEIIEGELEVVSRRQIAQHSEGGLVITEITYGLMYLLPIDLSAPRDDKLLPWNVPIFQKYLRYFVSWRRIEQKRDKVFVKTANFYIVPRRVDGNSEPIFTFFELIPSATHWPYVRMAGFASLGLALVLLAWRAMSIGIAHRRTKEEAATQLPPKAGELYKVWCQNPNQKIFLEALRFYRHGVWGRPQASTWVMTTAILYSGVAPSLEAQKTVFARLVKEVSDES
ncbi:hypothetical protein A3A84_00085 [Candidatus Collierbacteria bacterium RIFCSPLOWO2_01_FULL_50_23]|uniref:Uncharacterized protein n=2 Tax=Candidatus Collieribacteriota TaxID=1752725 RepID=A0A1F5ETW5_9BACT|nr:MAG: hypothetical protein A3D09_00210 [Candidatus Collierbacteria bacterium RIFCSPHIGHO2_02_FULL_49_10]OGD71252.1 MAG: hypothetical protein A2703_00805 [Candidatus Collierbacteria bacterium RIFCSPHIGHO2_01_FULL_50_25]OGD74204.1 MAG: hypothetical protein A3A84_00085 [Candidatus Collierbacteria bacterium RIFCSPLOWO2_01_FULL_50_23]